MANPNGTPIWFELTTSDQEKAQAFYTDVVGWTVIASPAPEHGGYRIANAPDGLGVAGLMKPPPGMTGLPGWTIYFAVDDVDAAAEKLKTLGGKVHFGPMDIPHVGRFATVSDPQGVPFQIMKGNSAESSQAFKQVPQDQDGGIGHGVWIELATPDPDAAFAFYGALFGWSKQGSMPMGNAGEYAFIGAAESRPGAVMSSKLTGAPPAWGVYFHVKDIDLAIDAARRGGGTLLQGPDQIPGGSYSAKLTDDLGFAFGIAGRRAA